MPVLHVDLQEGFYHDRVTVEVNGTPVLESEDVTTRTQVGHARSVEVETPEGHVSVAVDLQERNISEEFALEVSERPMYLGLSLSEGGIAKQISESPFRYL